MDRLIVSVVVVVHNIPREAPRTLYSLSAAYQRQIARDDFEVIVVDNGSEPPLDPALVAGLDGHFRLIRIDQAQPSPAAAINRGLADAKGDVIGVMIDGARMVTPGLLHFARHAAALHETAVVVTPGWYLGPDFQRRAMRRGYDRAREDALLESIDWPGDGYRLFEIGTVDESSGDGWFYPIAESNALFLRRDQWQALGGYDERFDAPGGGLVNLDTFRRAIEWPGAQLVLLVGEGTFHQVHGGISTNAPIEVQQKNFDRWSRQYRAIRGRVYDAPRLSRPPTYLGEMRWAAVKGLLRRNVKNLRERVAIRTRTPKDWVPRRLRLRVHLHLASICRRLGARERALRHCESALNLERESVDAYYLLASFKLPGDDYVKWLERLYGAVAPATAIEIGVYRGRTLALFQPPTLAIGVDPAPELAYPLSPTTRIVRETSDAFFSGGQASACLEGRPLSVGFVDGLHLFEQVLRDFIHLEALCGSRSVILIHDTVPPDEMSQLRERQVLFHAGDVWKIVPCLKYYRPDLDLFTVATPPTGLTVITGMNPGSTVLRDRYDEAVARFIDSPYSTLESPKEEALNLVPNDWAAVRSRLEDRGILDRPAPI